MTLKALGVLACLGLCTSPLFAAERYAADVIDLEDSLERVEARISLDSDGDGFAVSEGDCDDKDASTYPGASELPDDVDNNCNGSLDN